MAVTLCILAILIAANYWFGRSVIYPPFIFCSIWFLDIFVYSLNLIEIDPLHTPTLAVISVGAVMFSLGGACAFLVPSRIIGTRIAICGQPRGGGRLLKISLIVILFIGVCLQLRYLRGLAASVGGGGLGLLIAAREAMIEDANSAGTNAKWFTYVTSWTVFCAFLFRLDRRDLAARIMLGLALLSCLLSTGRGQFLGLFSGLTAMYLIDKGRERMAPAFRIARWPVTAFLLLFVLLMFTNKDTSKLTITPGKYVEGSLVGYLCGSTAALDQVLRHPTEYARPGPPGTLDPIFHVAGAVGLISYTPPPQFEEYVYVPFNINTFTLYKSWYMDYGPWLAMVSIGLLGLGHSLLYRKAHTGSVLGMYLFALSVQSALLVFFVDTYSSLSAYAHAFVFGVAYLTIRSLPGELFQPRLIGNAASGE